MIRNRQSVDIDSPYSDQTEQVIIDVLLISHSISVGIPEISTASLNSLSFLMA